MGVSAIALFTLLFVLSYLVAPAALAWGWARWTGRPKVWTISSTLSFVGFLLASASAVLAMSTVVYASNGGFETSYSFFYRVVGRGAVISLLATIFAIGGVWRQGSLRWQAPAGAIGTLAFWLVATTWP